MFDPDDPILSRVRQIALDLPGAAEKISHGRPAFYTKKVFAYYGGSVRRGPDDWVQHPQSVMVLLDEDERSEDWFTQLTDRPNPGAVSAEVSGLVPAVMAT